MIDRITKSWKSSLIGVAIIGAGFGLLYTEKVTMGEATPFLVGILGLLYKEKNNAKSENNDVAASDK